MSNPRPIPGASTTKTTTTTTTGNYNDVTTEPSYSYEEMNYMIQRKEEWIEDEYHNSHHHHNHHHSAARLATHKLAQSSTSNHPHHHYRHHSSSSSGGVGRGGGGDGGGSSNYRRSSNGSSSNHHHHHHSHHHRDRDRDHGGGTSRRSHSHNTHSINNHGHSLSHLYEQHNEQKRHHHLTHSLSMSANAGAPVSNGGHQNIPHQSSTGSSSSGGELERPERSGGVDSSNLTSGGSGGGSSFWRTSSASSCGGTGGGRNVAGGGQQQRDEAPAFSSAHITGRHKSEASASSASSGQFEAGMITPSSLTGGLLIGSQQHGVEKVNHYLNGQRNGSYSETAANGRKNGHLEIIGNAQNGMSHSSANPMASSSSAASGSSSTKQQQKEQQQREDSTRKKKETKLRKEERRRKMDEQLSGSGSDRGESFAIEQIIVPTKNDITALNSSSTSASTTLPPQSQLNSGGTTTATVAPPPKYDHPITSSLDRSTSNESAGSLLYGKTPTTSALIGKSSSFIFPTGVGVDSSPHGDSRRGGRGGSGINGNGVDGTDANNESAKLKRRKVNLLIDQAESIRFPFKKKLSLGNLGLSAADIPLKDLCGGPLGNSLHKLSLAGNRLGTVPPILVQSLFVLKTLDLSQCELNQLPDQWNLPKLATLNLSHNRFTDFPEESMLEGLPDLRDLNMYGNKVAQITVPSNPKLLSKLETLNLGYNDLVYLPDELDQLKSLKFLKVMNNFLARVPMRVCEMELQKIDVSSNPVTEPPIETCERGIFAMRRYWHCIKLEEQSKQKLQENNLSKQIKKNQRKGYSLYTPNSGNSSSGSGGNAPSVTAANNNGNSVSGSGVSPSAPSTSGVTSSLMSKKQSIMPLFTGHRSHSSSSGNSKSASGSPSSNRKTSVSPEITPAKSSSGGSSASAKPLPVSPPLTTTPPATTTDNRSSPPVPTIVPPKRDSGSPRSETIAVSKPPPSSTLSSADVIDDPAWSPGSQLFPESVNSSSSSRNRKDDPISSDFFDTAVSGGSVVSPTASVRPTLRPETSEIPLTDNADVIAESLATEDDFTPFSPDLSQGQDITVNDTLKVIFVGMAMVGKTSMIRRLIEGRNAEIPTMDERTVGVDIYEWEPKRDARFRHIESRIDFQDKELAKACGNVDVKFSVWDFAGQHVYHATHELFFSSRALYVLVWDMGATNHATKRRKVGKTSQEKGAFKLTYDSEDEEDEEDEDSDDNLAVEEESRRADRALERDIDEKVQFWVDCIQSTAPGSAILPVASFADFFNNEDGSDDGEARRRCRLLKERLEKHEERRLKGIEDRLDQYEKENRANDPAAVRLRKLRGSYTRPKLIFSDDDADSVVRVSGTEYTGFDRLTERILNIATGRYKGKWDYPIFHGHVGARIPRMRLDVRDAVREMRGKFKVVEWGYFISQLRDNGLTCVEDISDALHFLTNTGELSYFGSVMASKHNQAISLSSERENPNFPSTLRNSDSHVDEMDLEDMDEIDGEAMLSIDNTSITAINSEDGSWSAVDDLMSGSLSQFVFLNPRWLVAAVACILRHDLDREIKETRRLLASGESRRDNRCASFYDTHLNCPVITADDACMLWQSKKITKKAAERALASSNNVTLTPFEFLQLLLIRFGVFVPIDLTIDKALLGGKEYSRDSDSAEAALFASTTTEPPAVAPSEVSFDVITVPLHTFEDDVSRSKYFFLPSLLGPCEPSDAWTYKSNDAWKTTLCHSVLFPDGVPPGLMERLTASVLSDIHDMSHRHGEALSRDKSAQNATTEGRMCVKEVLCWRTAFFLKIGTEVRSSDDGPKKESIVEIFTHLADKESHLCVGSDLMGVGSRRLITGGLGQAGDGGRKIWKGGYLLVVKAVRRVMEAYGGLEYEEHGFCPRCLSEKPLSTTSCWDIPAIRSAVAKCEPTMRCNHGHRVDTRLLAGPVEKLQKMQDVQEEGDHIQGQIPVNSLLRSVVVVGLWDGKLRKVVRVGSGFIVDAKKGLIVTASHTLMNIWGDKSSPFGENYYGLRLGKVVIGVIPEDREADAPNAAVFRYFATILAKDPSLDSGECHLDACVLQITTRMETDVGGNGNGCGDVPEILLLNNKKLMKQEQLQALKVTDRCELDEGVRIIGYNQGGEGLLAPGESLNRYVDFAKGYVCMKFSNNSVADERQNGNDSANPSQQQRRDRFKPREEIVVMCRTIGGHSGGPCVNLQGEVVGILSRADPAENQRCYISPTSEWKPLVRQAKTQLKY